MLVLLKSSSLFTYDQVSWTKSPGQTLPFIHKRQKTNCAQGHPAHTKSFAIGRTWIIAG